eukprot:TRINITY_DN2580_c0_g1_i1.p1 TRINITY_DN2580_c0_g1~~TRINITY_DN2580_c0_g1_i1.p1  ORF type:complete len:1065 (+),score=225.78 TRINITY_DN2580_c0_g1_i1:94-3195(+)
MGCARLFALCLLEVLVSATREADGGLFLLSWPTRLDRASQEQPASTADDVEVSLAQRAEDLESELDVEVEREEPDVLSHVHDLSASDEAVAFVPSIGQAQLYGIDGTTGDKHQQCFIEGQRQRQFETPDNIENVVRDAFGQLNKDGTARGDWAKCLPPPMYTLLTMESFDEGDIESGIFETKMKDATDFYATLKWLHNEACSHIRLNIADPTLQRRIMNEINYKVEMGVGKKIAKVLGQLAEEIVRQYRSLSIATNKNNADALASLQAAVDASNAAIEQALNADFVTIKDVGGKRSARDALRDLQRNAMTTQQKIDYIEEFLADRPGYSDLLSDDFGKKPRKQGDGLPDVLQNVGMCGVKGSDPSDNSRLFEPHGFLLYTLGLSLSETGEVLIATRNGDISVDDLVASGTSKPLLSILPSGTVTSEDGKASYQDDLFAQGNLACGKRADDTWTLVTADRDNDSNPVTTTQEEGYFCIWELDDVTVLPENQRNGFSNTEFVANSPEKLAEVLNGDASFYQGFFPAAGDKKYYHCHYTPRNSGSMRVHSFQHQAERHYPGSVRQICGCDWRKLGMLVSRCDCTLDGEANGGCRKAEMEMLNEHTQRDLWSPEHGNSASSSRASQVARSHGKLVSGEVKSFDYNNGDIEVRRFQDDTGRVRTTGGGNDAVCAVDNNGSPGSRARGYVKPIVLTSKDAKNHSKSFFTDFDGNGIVALANCNKEAIQRGSCTLAKHDEGDAEEFALRDFTARRWNNNSQVAVPAGGVNLEFVDPFGKVCDALNLGTDCLPADAGTKQGEELTSFLASFCDTPASLYAVPSDNGKVPEGFGQVKSPLPHMPIGNFRSDARANFGRLGNGTWLFCQDGRCDAAYPASAAQGVFGRGIVTSSSPSDLFKGNFDLIAGGAPNMETPSAVPSEWLDQRNSAAGIFNKDVADRFADTAGLSAQVRAAVSMVTAEGGRTQGVTCLNGKYIYIRELADGSRPVVSTVREGLNRQGPRPINGPWACRYLGVYCNAGNCNNNGNTDVPGPFVEMGHHV